MLPVHRTGWGNPFVLEIGRTCLSASDPFSEESPRLSVPFGAATDSSLGVSASAHTDRGSGTASRWKNVPIERQIRTRSSFGSSCGRIRHGPLPLLLRARPHQVTRTKTLSLKLPFPPNARLAALARNWNNWGTTFPQTPPLGGTAKSLPGAASPTSSKEERSPSL